MRHLPPSETQRNFGLVTVFEKFDQVFQFHLIIAIFGAGPELDFLELCGFLFFPARILLFVCLELEPAVVHDLAHRRRDVGRYFHQIALLQAHQSLRFFGLSF